MRTMKYCAAVLAALTMAHQASAALTLNLGKAPRVDDATQTWTFKADGSAVTNTSAGGSSIFTTLADGLSGSLTNEGATGTFTVTIEATYLFDKVSFTNSLSPGNPPTSNNRWAYNASSDTFGIVSPVDTTIGIASSEAMVMTFDLSNLTLPSGKFLYVDGFKLENGTAATPSGLRVSYLANGTSTGVKLTGSGTAFPAVGGLGVFQPVFQAIDSVTNDKVAIWAENIAGQKRFMGFQFSISAPVSGTDKPENLTAISADAAAKLNWDDDLSGYPLSYYTLYRGTASGTNNYDFSTNLTVSAYLDTGLSNGIPYYYAVTSTGTNNQESAYSDEIIATPQASSYVGGLIQHLDATIASSVTLSNGNIVTGWADQTTNGYHAIADASGNRVLWPSASKSASNLSGMDMRTNRAVLATMNAAATDTFMDFTGTALEKSGFTVLIAFKADYVTQDNTRNILIGNQENADGGGFGLRYDRGKVQAFANGKKIDKTVSYGGNNIVDGDTAVFAFSYKVTTGQMSLWDSKNGTVATATTTAYGDFSQPRQMLIGGSSNTGQYMDGMIGEIKVFDKFLSESELVSEGQSLATKWGGSVVTGYELWSGDWGVALGSSTNDYDNDGLLNVYEYGLGGDPTNSASRGYEPTYGSVAAGGTNWFQFVHVKLTDDNSGITYEVQATDNLVFPSWTNLHVVIVGSGPFAPGFDAVTNRVPTAGKAKQFMRLIIE